LEGLGFSVEERARVRGLSGFEHSFALVARKGGRMVCVSIVHSSPASILAEVAKGFDVPHEIVVAVEGEPPPKAIELSRKGRVKIVAFKSGEELAEELKKALA
jgi:hypothetical protein